jgi:hypothetical protein
MKITEKHIRKSYCAVCGNPSGGDYCDCLEIEEDKTVEVEI